MSKDIPPNGKSLTREEMLGRRRRQEYEDTKNELNEFSRRALSGLQYLPEEEGLEAALRRLERKAGFSSGRGRAFSLPRILSFAASIAVLLVAGYFLYTQPSGNEAVFARHFDYLPSATDAEGGDRNLPATRAGAEEAAEQRTKAMQAYEEGDYRQAKSLMEKYLSGNPADTEIQLYLGIVLLGEGRADLAITKLSAALEALPRPAYERPARWYLALAFLRDGQPEKAGALFAELSEGNDRYAAGARDALVVINP